MATIERYNVKIAYHSAGKGDTTLLFVHGAFIDMNYWSAQIDYFKTHYRVITIDLPGHGQSGKNRATWNIEEYGKDICTLINELHLKNIVLIGHSMGGDVILEVASRCSDSVIGFVGVDNFKNAGTPLPEEFQSQVALILKMLKSDFANTSENYARKALLSESTDKIIIDRVVSDYRKMDEKIGYDLISDSFTYSDREKELMTGLKYKMYLVNVGYSPTNEELLRKFAASGYELIPFKGSCHFPMIENPEEFNRILHDILVKIKATR
jgi:sigma-B regulation protein RsbQ